MFKSNQPKLWEEWRGASGYGLMRHVALRTGSEHAYWLVRQWLRCLLPHVWVADGYERSYISFADPLGSASRTFSSWASPPILRSAFNLIRDQAASQRAVRRKSFDAVVRLVFPHDAKLELGADIVTDRDFRPMALAMLDGSAGGVAADWLQDRGEDTLAEHWREIVASGLRVVPWWLRDEVTGYFSQQFQQPAEGITETWSPLEAEGA